jgi:glutamate/tyrosine decarboxylase-like PLP-dependent enzyme
MFEIGEIELLREADERARRYLADVRSRRVFPSQDAIAALDRFDEPLPQQEGSAQETLALLDDVGGPGTVTSNGPHYYGFVIGAAHPAAAAAERLASAWDQCASSFDNSPVAHMIEKVAARWVLEALDLPREGAVTFGTSASACGLACLVAARRALLAGKGWDFDAKGVQGAPDIRVVVSDAVHITVLKALRLLGFGTDRIIRAPVDRHSRIDPDRLPDMDDQTILCLQAGEVNTGEFDPFLPLIGKARATGAWVHVDGAFGLWARTSEAKRNLTEGIEGADSWTTDGHKWLNTPYDGAMGICRRADDLAGAMNADAVYSSASSDSQKNLGIEFSRKARGIPVWALLRTLGKDGVARLVERHCEYAQRLAGGLRDSGAEILNRVVLNQVLFRLESDQATLAFREAAVDSGRIWFGPTVFEGRPACRISVSSFRTADGDVDAAIKLFGELACTPAP